MKTHKYKKNTFTYRETYVFRQFNASVESSQETIAFSLIRIFRIDTDQC